MRSPTTEKASECETQRQSNNVEQGQRPISQLRTLAHCSVGSAGLQARLRRGAGQKVPQGDKEIILPADQLSSPNERFPHAQNRFPMHGIKALSAADFNHRDAGHTQLVNELIGNCQDIGFADNQDFGLVDFNFSSGIL
jgi:hypothetical protein